MAQVYAAKYLAKAALSAPRDLVNSYIGRVKALHPTVLIFHVTFVCDARCNMSRVCLAVLAGSASLFAFQASPTVSAERAAFDAWLDGQATQALDGRHGESTTTQS